MRCRAHWEFVKFFLINVEVRRSSHDPAFGVDILSVPLEAVSSEPLFRNGGIIG